MLQKNLHKIGLLRTTGMTKVLAAKMKICTARFALFTNGTGHLERVNGWISLLISPSYRENFTHFFPLLLLKHSIRPSVRVYHCSSCSQGSWGCWSLSQLSRGQVAGSSQG